MTPQILMYLHPAGEVPVNCSSVILWPVLKCSDHTSHRLVLCILYIQLPFIPQVTTCTQLQIPRNKIHITAISKTQYALFQANPNSICLYASHYFRNA